LGRQEGLYCNNGSQDGGVFWDEFGKSQSWSDVFGEPNHLSFNKTDDLEFLPLCTVDVEENDDEELHCGNLEDQTPHYNMIGDANGS
jgi:hypothetical protein